jgi:hypothetical protein
VTTVTRVPDERTRRWRGTGADRWTRLGLGAATGLATVGLLVGCAGQPGAAAVVDGRAIPVADVHTAAEQLAPFFEGASPANILTVLVQEPTVSAFAAEQGLAVSDQAAREQLADAATRLEVPSADEFDEPSIAVSRYLLAYEQISGSPDAEALLPELERELTDLDVEVSPRFGALDEENRLVAVDRPWLVPTGDEATAR